MATIPADVPGAAAPDYGGFPSQGANEQDAQGRRSRARLAREVAEQHRRMLRTRRERDLTAEKYLIHIDGEGDNQYADVVRGSRVEIPKFISRYRMQENLLRPIVDNAVAHHTAQPFRFVADHKQDAESRRQAKIDAAFANHLARIQRWNAVFAEAMYLAMACGFCPVHAYWRDDLQTDPYEPLYAGRGGPQSRFKPRLGSIDSWVGNPFDHGFNPGAKRGSIQAGTYGRVLPADLVRRAFADVLEESGTRLEGTDRLPSATTWNRVASNWRMTGLNVHGSATLNPGGEAGEELVALVCREIAPGIDPEAPDGRLTIVALQGTADTRRHEGRSDHTGEAILLADQPLPGGRFSWELVYSHHRFDSAEGKAFVGDLDDLQVQLNLALSQRREYIQRMLHAPTLVGGVLNQDAAEYDGFTLLEVDAGAGGQIQPRTVELPGSPLSALDNHIEQLRQAIYTIGGYQAASRGESKSGDAASKVVALARADDTIHSPINQVFQDAVCDYAGLCWALMKQYGDVPWVIDVVGDDDAHIVQEYVDRTELGDRPPAYRLVSIAGATPEAHAQQLMQLVQATGADGQPLLPTEQFRRRWPDQNLYDEESHPGAVQRRRARTVAQRIRDMARQASEQTGIPKETPEMHPAVQQVAQQVFAAVEQQYRRKRDDDLGAHIEALAEITQDETEHPIARLAAEMRQTMYFQWQAMQAQQAAAQQAAEAQQQQGRSGAERGGGARRAPEAHPAGGTRTSEAMSPSRTRPEVRRMTAQARGA
ncbi:MAG: hypothetical protein ACOC8B_06820 [Gemmatimonadota bacterium]